MSKVKKGIILAGGSGSRLYPLTTFLTKQLQPVYDKPMIYYPLSTLIENGVAEICLISKPDQLPLFESILGDGSKFGVRIEYHPQPSPDGIAQSFLIAEDFIGKESVALILGDNIFHSPAVFRDTFANFEGGAAIFAYRVQDPQRYGVVEFDPSGNAVSLEEKPKQPKSNYVVPGIYLYDRNVARLTRELKPSARGELEITDLNLAYLHAKTLRVSRLPRGFAWLDAGTSSSLHEASSFVQTLEKRQGIKIGCPEEAAYRAGLIGKKKLCELIHAMPACEYKDYLLKLEREIEAELDGA
ncbi:MAG: glucose-1-phosphate thymidylyltransferase RfbA [Methylacidiphilales bacterium]|nr:glucose-1-phosphate thymidylyltransferase RfbA [Candidatus Methylacidiphilales bacterium]